MVKALDGCILSHHDIFHLLELILNHIDLVIVCLQHAKYPLKGRLVGRFVNQAHFLGDKSFQSRFNLNKSGQFRVVLQLPFQVLVSNALFNKLVEPLEYKVKFVTHSVVDLSLAIPMVLYPTFQVVYLELKLFIRNKFIIYLLNLVVNFLEHFLLDLVVNMWEYFGFNAECYGSLVLVLQVNQVLQLGKLLRMRLMPVLGVFDLLQEVSEKRLALVVDLLEDLFELLLVAVSFLLVFLFKEQEFI